MTTAYRRYEKYKDSGVEWIGEVPEGWEVSRIKFFYETCLGKMVQPNANSVNDTLENYLCSINVTWNGIDTTNIKEMWFSENEKRKYRILKGDLIINEGGDAGRSAIWEGQIENCYIQNAVHRVRGKDKNSNKFLYYWVYYLKSLGYIELICNKATIMHYTGEKLLDTVFLAPPVNEQIAITNFLDQKTSEIDALIDDKEKLIELLQEKRQAIISETVTKGLDNNVKMKDSGIEWIGEVPESWESSKIKYITDINARTLNEAVDEDYEIKYLDISNVTSNGEILDTQIYRFKEAPSRARRIIIDGDTIVSTVRTYLQAIAWIPKSEENLICSTGFAVLSPKNKVLPEYLAYLMRSTKYINEIVARSVGISYPAINASEIGDLECFIPTLEEQREIISFINEQVIDIVNLVEELNIQIDKLKEYRQSLISEAVTGKIMV